MDSSADKKKKDEEMEKMLLHMHLQCWDYHTKKGVSRETTVDICTEYLNASVREYNRISSYNERILKMMGK